MDYEGQYRQLHDNPKRFPGQTILHYVETITKLVHQHRPSRMLDYGCGKGYQYLAQRIHERWGGPLPVCYDIGVRQLSTKPEGLFGGVLCTDVLEHIEEPDLPALLDELFGYAEPGGFVFLSIACRPTKKVLPQGGDVHRTIQPPSWWIDLISRHRPTSLHVRADFDLGEPAHFPDEVLGTGYVWRAGQ